MNSPPNQLVSRSEPRGTDGNHASTTNLLHCAVYKVAGGVGFAYKIALVRTKPYQILAAVCPYSQVLVDLAHAYGLLKVGIF